MHSSSYHQHVNMTNHFASHQLRRSELGFVSWDLFFFSFHSSFWIAVLTSVHICFDFGSEIAKYINNVHLNISKATFLKSSGTSLHPHAPQPHRFTWASILQRTCEHLTGLPLGRDPINKPQQSFSHCERKALHCELLYTAVRFTIPNGSLSRVTRSPWKFSQSLLLNLWQLHH